MISLTSGRLKIRPLNSPDTRSPTAHFFLGDRDGSEGTVKDVFFLYSGMGMLMLFLPLVFFLEVELARWRPPAVVGLCLSRGHLERPRDSSSGREAGDEVDA
jgi:hypothetical protein